MKRVENPDKLLQSYTPSERVALVKRMLERHPDLEALLERYPPQATVSQLTVNPEHIRRQVATIFRNVGDEWGAGYGLSRDLLDLVRQGDEYAAAGKLADAVAVYHTVARETLARYSEAPDEEGETLEPVAECVAGLTKCLQGADHPAQREAILRTLFDIYAWDVEYGGVGAAALWKLPAGVGSGPPGRRRLPAHLSRGRPAESAGRPPTRPGPGRRGDSRHAGGRRLGRD